MNKKIIFLITFLLISGITYTEEKINIFTSTSYLPAKMYNLGIELPIEKRKSIEMQAFYYDFFLGEGYSTGVFGKYKVYAKPNYEGWFSAAFMEIDYVKSKDHLTGFFISEKGEGFGVMMGIEGGYKVLIANKIGVSFSVMPGYRYERMHFDKENDTIERYGYILLPDILKLHIVF